MKKLALAMTACAALALTGCGDDAAKKSDEAAPATTAPATLTKAEFLAQADKLCADTNAKIDAASADLNENSTEADIQAFTTETVLPEAKALIEAVDALVPPTEIAAQVDAMVAEVKSEIAKVEADWTYGMADESFVKADKMAVDLGLPACGE